MKIRDLFGAIAAASLVFAFGSTAQAAVLTFSIHGTWDDLEHDFVPDATNTLASLVGQTYSMSMTVSTDNYHLISSTIDASTTPPTSRTWRYANNSSMSTSGVTWSSAADGTTLGIVDNFYHDGSLAVSGLANGYYDILEIGGESPGGGLYSSGLILIGTPDLFSGVSANPLGSMDFGKLIYATTYLDKFGGVLADSPPVGGVRQDPPISFHHGVLSGPGLNVGVAITAVPEPATWALMIGGFGLAGAALRRRRSMVAA